MFNSGLCYLKGNIRYLSFGIASPFYGDSLTRLFRKADYTIGMVSPYRGTSLIRNAHPPRITMRP